MKTRLQKEESITELTEKFSRAKSVVLTDYQGLTMKQLSELRDKLRDVDAELQVTKNTLLARSLPDGVSLPESSFQGSTATLFAYDDEISPIKLLVKALKEASIGKIKAIPSGGM